MGSRMDLLMICVVWFCQLVGASGSYSRDSLDSLLYDSALKKLNPLRTGKLYRVPLPPTFAGMELSVLRLRARGLWRNGVNYTSIQIPPSVLPRPFVRRLDLVYQNLGNWSSVYHNLSDYRFIAPVTGFLAYDPNLSSKTYGMIDLEVIGNGSFVVKFPNVSVSEEGTWGAKCVRFDKNGSVDFSNIMDGKSCVGRRLGHFSIVVPYDEHKGSNKKRWRIGIAVGVVGLVLLVAIGFVSYMWIKGETIKKMERESETSVELGIIWIELSRMPFAPAIRTQPVLENSSES